VHSTDRTPVVRANFGNLHDAALIVASAFASLDVAAWLIGAERDRERVLYANVQIWVQHAIEHGEVWLTDDRSAVAVWFPYEHGAPPAPAHYDQRLALATGDYAPRFRLLDEWLQAHHPTRVPHHHLAFLAVRPNAQGLGLGSTLLAHHHARLDFERVAGYLEASSQRSRAL
jgi:GNAT superfamily N-acetyltransferase